MRVEQNIGLFNTIACLICNQNWKSSYTILTRTELFHMRALWYYILE